MHPSACVPWDHVGALSGLQGDAQHAVRPSKSVQAAERLAEELRISAYLPEGLDPTTRTNVLKR